MERLLTWNPPGFTVWIEAPIKPEQKESKQLCLHASDGGVVISVDEKTSIQSLERWRRE